MNKRIHVHALLLFGAVLAVGIGIAEAFKDDGLPRLQLPREDQLRAATAKPARFDFEEMPLEDALKHLAARHGIEIFLNRRALDDEGIAPDQPISMDLKDVSLGSGLRLMLKQLGLTWQIKNEVLEVTTMTEAESDLTTRIYDVQDLLEAQQEHAGSFRTYDYDLLMDILTSTVAPQSWDDVGGPGSVQPFTGLLVISQTESVHGQIEKLFTKLRRGLNVREHAEARAAENAKNKPMVVRAYSLSDWLPVEEVTRTHTTTKRPLPDEPPAQPETKGQAANANGQGKPAEQADAAPGEVTTNENTSVVRHRDGEGFANKVAAAVEALVAPESWKSQGGQGVIRPVPGAILVRATPAVHQEIRSVLRSWADTEPNGNRLGLGCAPCGGFGAGGGGGFGGGAGGGVGGGGFFQLPVKQPNAPAKQAAPAGPPKPPKQKAPALPAGNAKQNPPKPAPERAEQGAKPLPQPQLQLLLERFEPYYSGTGDSEAEKEFRRKLTKRVDVDFDNRSLLAVLAWLKARGDFLLNIDHQALTDEGIQLHNLGANLGAKGISLGAVLDAVLKQNDLTWVVRHGQVLVTTQTAAEDHLTVKAYEVRDLLVEQPHEEVISADYDYDSLIGLIQATVGPQTWDEVGGAGTAQSFQGMLVIAQTRAVHDQLHRLLVQLRQVRGNREYKHKPKEEPVLCRAYAMTDLVPSHAGAGDLCGSASSGDSQAVRAAHLEKWAGQFANAVAATIEPQSWQKQGGPGEIRVAGPVVFVRHTGRVHRQIARQLDRLSPKDIYGYSGKFPNQAAICW